MQLSIATNGHTPLGKKQKRFNSLVKSANQLREALRAWRDADYELHRNAAEHEKLLAQTRHAKRELVVLFDQHARDPMFTKAERTQLIAVAVDMAREVLSAIDDAELKAIYNRHTKSDFDAEVAEEEAARSRQMQDVLEEHGFEFDERYESLEELEAAARAQHAERSRATDERRTKRKKTPRQQAAEARRDAQQFQIGKALQEVYRRLVRALHPDHEQDPVERARKTALMQDVNVAYERKDLLALLELQLRFEQLDADHMANLAEERLDHFNQLLGEQVAQLREELAAIEHPYRIELEVYPPRKLSVAHVLACLRDELDGFTHDVARMRHDLRVFREAAGVKAWLRDQRDRASREARELAAFMAMVGSAPRRRRRG